MRRRNQLRRIYVTEFVIEVKNHGELAVVKHRRRF